MTKQKVTAGKDALGAFAPEFARYNDEILFGEVWENHALSQKDRSLLTVAALVTGGIFDSSLEFHLGKAKKNGISKEEIGAALTHLAFYSGWPKAWAAFRIAKDIWAEENSTSALPSDTLFPLGEPNIAYAKYFTGKSYLKMLTTEGVPIAHVTFEPGCRNWWHIHHKGGQILLVTEGRGYYQEFGKMAQELRPGDTVNISPEIKHWHGAAADSWFSHIAVEIPFPGSSTEWVEPVDDKEYAKSNSITSEAFRKE
jgi:alkylhydroperoxidase/carboxymuconolactone decarboxylase family protein YurZ/quercetin dioxygenase-like cupin family protein